MEVVKDLTDKLRELEAKDQVYYVRGKFMKLLADQDPRYCRPVRIVKNSWGTIERVEAVTSGSPTAQRTPLVTKRVRKGQGEVKETTAWSFRKDKKGRILLHIGGSWGLVKRSLRHMLEAMNKFRYENPRLDLVRIVPEWMDVGPYPAESMNDGNAPEIVLTKRHTMRGDVMVEEAFDWLADRPFEFYIKVDSECPINEERMTGLVKSLSNLDRVGASGRGSMVIEELKIVKGPAA